ncbi:transcriptional regulator [Rhodococcus sp. WMMA185]|uniref:helix-turn-helix domain-containing protein n=1 Tax=Rhodococcus sp. WMMA185 TaxID=679318 RepID=UPI0008788046|nr:helix-turn-helix transcriptional regulator [Rhodococcus sp. WMMA185]AOW93678.1 transcriptional regulator [Rhodococcus sp. WMMA185]
MPPELEHAVRCHLDELLSDRSMTLATLSERVGVSVANLSVLKNDRARAIRFSTLTAICQVLQCSVGDLFSVDPTSPTAEAPSLTQAGR